MPVEFQEFGPKLRRDATKVLLGECVEQLRVRLIVEPNFPGPVTSSCQNCCLAGPAGRCLPGLAASGSDPELR
jgi:hypothetical protein